MISLLHLSLIVVVSINAQNVGIGTTNPVAALDVHSTTGLTSKFNSTSNNMFLGLYENNSLRGYIGSYSGFAEDFDIGTSSNNSTGRLHFTINATPKMTIDNAGNVGIGTIFPIVRLTVDSSIMVDEANSNQGFLDRSSLYFGNDKRVGIVRSFLAGSAGRNGLGFFTANTRRMTIDSTGQVGIGTINPLQMLHVNGPSYFVGNMGIGSSTPDYAFENLFGYNYMFYGLGVGTVPSATYLLDIGAGASGARFQGDVRINGLLNPTTTLNIGNNASVEGTLTV